MLRVVDRLAVTAAGDVVDELVEEAVTELNRLNKLDETVARLHPDSEHWHIDVDSRDGFVQAHNDEMLERSRKYADREARRKSSS